MMEMNVGGIIVEHVIEKLWDQYLSEKWAAEAEDDVDKKLLAMDTPDGKDVTHFEKKRKKKG